MTRPDLVRRLRDVGCHPDLDVARDLIRGAVAVFAHFSSMPGSTGAGLADADRAVVAEVGRRYDSNEHLQQHRRAHRGTGARVRRPVRSRRAPAGCVPRSDSAAFVDLGLERFVITGASFRGRTATTAAPPRNCSPRICSRCSKSGVRP